MDNKVNDRYLWGFKDFGRDYIIRKPERDVVYKCDATANKVLIGKDWHPIEGKKERNRWEKLEKDGTIEATDIVSVRDGSGDLIHLFLFAHSDALDRLDSAYDATRWNYRKSLMLLMGGKS